MPHPLSLPSTDRCLLPPVLFPDDWQPPFPHGVHPEDIPGTLQHLLVCPKSPGYNSHSNSSDEVQALSTLYLAILPYLTKSQFLKLSYLCTQTAPITVITLYQQHNNLADI